MLLSPIDDPFPRQSIPSSVTYSRFRAVLFHDLLDTNPANRGRALDNIVQIVTEWARVVTDNGALADLSRPGSFSAASGLHGNPTPPFSPGGTSGTASCSIEGTLFPSSSAACPEDGQHQDPLGNMERLTISTNAHQPASTAESVSPPRSRPRKDSSVSSTSPLAGSPNSNGVCHSTSSSTSNPDTAGNPNNVLSSSPMNQSSYHFQNDPDVHFNRSLPDKLSPLEERVAEVDEAARLLRHHILTILRFSVCCPYKDVKLCLVGLLNELEVCCFVLLDLSSCCLRWSMFVCVWANVHGAHTWMPGNAPLIVNPSPSFHLIDTDAPHSYPKADPHISVVLY